jgi:hypothetical protein
MPGLPREYKFSRPAEIAEKALHFVPAVALAIGLDDRFSTEGMDRGFS